VGDGKDVKEKSINRCIVNQIKREELMEEANRQDKKRKRKWGSMILNFLMYGGWLLVVAAAVGVAIFVSVLTK